MSLLTLQAKADAFDAIADLLRPQEDPNAEWDSAWDLIEEIEGYVLSVYPKAAKGSRELAEHAQ